MNRTLILKSLAVVVALAFTVLFGVKAAAAANDSTYPKNCVIIQAERPSR